MSYAITVKEPGDSSVLSVTPIDIPSPGENDVVVEHSHIGLNFIDTYHRSGLYPVQDSPFIPGLEASGTIIATGSNAKEFQVGDRVGYGTGPMGAYATHRIIDKDKIVKLNQNIPNDIAAASLLKGMTVEYLVQRTYPVKAGETVLFHAISGGVGTIACQWLKHIGANVIGTVGSDEKAKKAKELGCDHVIRYDQESFKDRVLEITNGQGVPVVYDSIGQDTFYDSLDCLQDRGLMVSFGNASGPVKPFSPSVLSEKGSLYLTRPSLMAYAKTQKEMQDSADALFDLIKSGKIQIDIGQSYPLKEAQQAHIDLESRKTSGSTLLIP